MVQFGRDETSKKPVAAGNSKVTGIRYTADDLALIDELYELAGVRSKSEISRMGLLALKEKLTGKRWARSTTKPAAK